MPCQSPNHSFHAARRVHKERPEKRRFTEAIIYFRCPGCKKTFCHFCEGGADDMPEHYDACWSDVFHGEGLWAWAQRLYYRARRAIEDFWWVVRLG